MDIDTFREQLEKLAKDVGSWQLKPSMEVAVLSCYTQFVIAASHSLSLKHARPHAVEEQQAEIRRLGAMIRHHTVER